MADGTHGGRRSPRATSTLLVILAVLLVLVLSSTSTIVPPAAAPRVVGTTGHESPPTWSASGGGPGLPGSDPSVNSTPLAISSLVPSIARFATASAEIGGLVAAHPKGPSIEDLLLANSTERAAPSALPAVDGQVTGFFVGYVNLTGTKNGGLVGVTVQAFNLDNTPCPSDVCSPANSNTTGFYNVTCYAGRSYITFQRAWLAENLTYATCVGGRATWVPTTYLLRDGEVEGTLLGDDPHHGPIPGVSVTGSSRDFSLIASPTVTTASNGSFLVPVPPNVASRIDFSPPEPSFLANFTDVFALAGQTVNIGIVYLEPQVIVEAQLYDAVSKEAVGGYFDAPLSLTVCSLTTNTCSAQGPPTEAGNTVRGTGPPGYDYVKADAPGYIENVTPIGFIPKVAPGTQVCVPDQCRIYLMPEGSVTLRVGTTVPAAGTNGLWIVTVCGMDGYNAVIPRYNPATHTFNTTTTTCLTSGCDPVGTRLTAPALPLRDYIEVDPDTTGICGDGFPTWPIPGDTPVWANYTWANVTPDENLNLGPLNLIVGAYLEGHVFIDGTGAAPSGFDASVASRESSTVAVYPYVEGQSPDECPLSGGTVFCAPAPPGPGELTVTATGYDQNFTWINLPWNLSASASQQATLAASTLNHVKSINMTGLTNVVGVVGVVGGGTVPYASINVCPAASQSDAPCVGGSAGPSGAFNLSGTPPGWDAVTAVGAGLSPNTVWAFSSPSAVGEAGRIPLTPLAVVQGAVDAPNGTGLTDVVIDSCSLTSWAQSGECAQPLGSGLTTSNGEYLGELTSGWLPGATDVIEASSPGYTSDWTFINATANGTVIVPTLVLGVVGQGPPAARDSRAPQAPSSGVVWVSGRVLDNDTGWGIDTAQITACPVGPGECTTFVDGSNTGGYFNETLPLGVYNITFSPGGYYARTVLVPALEGPSANLGVIGLNGLGWLNGWTAINPWVNVVTLNPTNGNVVTVHLAPQATAYICTASRSWCGQAEPDATSGAFEINTVTGKYLLLRITPTYTGSFSSAAGGFNANQSLVNITAGTFYTNLSASTPVPLGIYVTISGRAWDGSTYSSALKRGGRAAMWTTVSSSTSGVINGIATATTNGLGEYVLFLPGDNPQGETTVTAGNDQTFYAVKVTPFVWLGVGQNLTYVVPAFNLTAFGWAVATIVNNATGTVIPGVGITASFDDPITQQAASTSGVTNGAGYVNITAPPGESVLFTVGGQDDFNSTTLDASVAEATTTFVNASHPVALVPWGWAASEYLNYTTVGAYRGTVFDPVAGQAIAGASVGVVPQDPDLPASSSAVSNGLGEFLSDAAVGAVGVQVAATGYLANDTLTLGIAPGGFSKVARVNLTGDGVLAGVVLGEPSGTPVPGATVRACPSGSPYSGLCDTLTTNLSGVYWAPVPPGAIQITVTAPDYVSNYTEYVGATADRWTWVPAYQMDEDGFVSGTVQGLPTGLPVAQATVSACSPLGVPVGPCLFSVNSLPDGGFTLPVIPGSYILAASAPFYNSSFLPIAVVSGATVNVGAIFLMQYGFVEGSVFDASTGAPVANATVGGCPVLAWMPCDLPTTTNASGDYELASPPGTTVITVSAPPYVTGFDSATVVSAATTVLPPLYLQELGVETWYGVSGSVVQGSGTDAGAPVAEALVTFDVDGAAAFSTETGPSGGFSTTVLSGTYTIVVSAPGFQPTSAPLDLEAPVTGLRFSLVQTMYPVSGTIVDGLTGEPLAGATVSIPGVEVTTTDAAGAFSAEAPNGTYLITAAAGGTAAGEYAPVVFEVVVLDQSVTRAVELYPTVAELVGAVYAVGTDAPVPGAHLVVTGTATDGAAIALVGTSDLSGAFALSTYDGTYTVFVSAPGYHSVTVPVTVAGNLTQVAVDLTPLSAPAGSGLSLWVIGAVAVAMGATAGFILLVGWRRRTKP